MQLILTVLLQRYPGVSKKKFIGGYNKGRTAKVKILKAEGFI